MTDSEAFDRIVGPCIQLVRTGSFTTVFKDKAMIDGLTGLSSREDYLGVQSRAILAETKDQISDYPEAAGLANFEVGQRQIQLLERAIRRRTPERRVVRAHAWLLLQCAVSEFRREGGHEQGLDLLTRGVELITANSGEAIDSQHIESLFHFWRARILSTASYLFPAADVAFEQALRVADATLADKLEQSNTAHNEAERERLRNTHMAAGTYVLSAILGFGLAQARQQASRLRESLWFLRAAVPLSRGSRDFHRRGFAHLLTGTALRGIAQLGSRELAEAKEQLDKAKELLESFHPHRLHLARVHHQLALLHYNRVPPAGPLSREHREDLKKALVDNEEASTKSGDPYYENFRDPLLAYGIRVARSLIETRLGYFDEGYKNADQALRDIGYNAPRETHGWALVAKGMACAERVEVPEQIVDIEKAENALLLVVNDTELRPTDRAAAGLHLSRLYARIGQPFKAEIHFERAKPVVEISEHGWLRDLQTCAKAALGGDTGPELRLNVDDLLRAAHEQGDEQGPWKYINKYLDVKLKRRLLLLEQHQNILKQTDGEEKLAHQLGLTRATLFAWKREPELKDLFPARSRTSKRARARHTPRPQSD